MNENAHVWQSLFYYIPPRPLRPLRPRPPQLRPLLLPPPPTPLRPLLPQKVPPFLFPSQYVGAGEDDGLISGVSALARSEVPVGKSAAVGLRWAVSFPGHLDKGVPFLMLEKLRVERMEDAVVPASESAIARETVEGMEGDRVDKVARRRIEISGAGGEVAGEEEDGGVGEVEGEEEVGGRGGGGEGGERN